MNLRKARARRRVELDILEDLSNLCTSISCTQIMYLAKTTVKIQLYKNCQLYDKCSLRNISLANEKACEK